MEQKIYFDPKGPLCQEIQRQIEGGRKEGPWYPYPFMPIRRDERGLHFRPEFPPRWNAHELANQVVWVTIEWVLGVGFKLREYRQGKARAEVYEKEGRCHLSVSAPTLDEAKKAFDAVWVGKHAS